MDRSEDSSEDGAACSEVDGVVARIVVNCSEDEGVVVRIAEQMEGVCWRVVKVGEGGWVVRMEVVAVRIASDLPLFCCVQIPHVLRTSQGLYNPSIIRTDPKTNPSVTLSPIEFSFSHHATTGAADILRILLQALPLHLVDLVGVRGPGGVLPNVRSRVHVIESWSSNLAASTRVGGGDCRDLLFFSVSEVAQRLSYPPPVHIRGCRVLPRNGHV